MFIIIINIYIWFASILINQCYIAYDKPICCTNTIINNRLVYYRRISNEEDPFQNGFKEKSRTIDDAFILNGIIENYKALGQPLCIRYVDFKFAFDYINRNALLFKLLKRGVTGKMLRILKSMFSKAKSCAKWNGSLSEAFENLNGVLQGEVTSPSLFNIFLEDLIIYLDMTYGVKMCNTTIAYLLFADDLVLISDTPSDLQKLVDGLYQFCQKWHMIVNLTNTKISIFNMNKKKSSRYHFVYNEDEIEITGQYKYVGIIFSTSKNMFHKSREYLANQARKAIYAVKNMSSDTLGDLPPVLKFKIFDSQILSILEYGSEIWSTGSEINVLECVLLKYSKQVLGVKPQTSTLAAYGETGRFPLVLGQSLNVVKYWYRILTMEPSSVVKCVYDELYSLHAKGHSTWCCKIPNILNMYGHGADWDRQQTDLSGFNSHIKEKIYSKYIDDWYNSIQNSVANPILRTYKLFKTEFQMEPYLTHVKHPQIRRSLSKFRTSSHMLRIETGRHQKPKLEASQRTCLFCNTNDIDDELHLMLVCPFHADERFLLFREINVEEMCSSDKEQFIKIMKNKSEKGVRRLGRFLHQCFDKRKRSMLDWLHISIKPIHNIPLDLLSIHYLQ